MSRLDWTREILCVSVYRWLCGVVLVMLLMHGVGIVDLRQGNSDLDLSYSTNQSKMNSTRSSNPVSSSISLGVVMSWLSSDLGVVNVEDIESAFGSSVGAHSDNQSMLPRASRASSCTLVRILCSSD